MISQFTKGMKLSEVSYGANSIKKSIRLTKPQTLKKNLKSCHKVQNLMNKTKPYTKLTKKKTPPN